MSTDAEDANFDETLKNLQLLNAATAAGGPADQPSSSRVIPVNPFQLRPACTSADHQRTSDAIVKQIFGARCECGAERSVSQATAASKHHHTSLEHGIINPTPFKHKAKGEKKVIVREAILKNIGKCVHQNLVKQQNVAKEQQQQRLSATFLPAPSPLKPSRSENNLAAKGFSGDAGDDILDFRLLVAQCSELTLSNGSKANQDGPNYSRTSFKTLRQPEIFASSGSNPMAFIGPSRRNRRARQLKRYNSTSSLESDSSSSGGGGGGNVLPLSRTPPHPSGAGSQPGQHQQSQQQSPSASSSPTASASSSASCSTQARLNAGAMPCDITIDEMASYFETLVHIPKKMSSMAEMMYI